jgi:hypothetical protein
MSNQCYVAKRPTSRYAGDPVQLTADRAPPAPKDAGITARLMPGLVGRPVVLHHPPNAMSKSVIV